MVRMPHWPAAKFQVNPINLGRENIKAVLTGLGNPQNALPPIIHIAGTNGKGSTASFIRSILEAHGLRVHLYTSPHLIRFNERIMLNGREITDQMLFDYTDRTRIVAEDLNIELTFFEGTTAAAFLAFNENPADVLVMETGLGGRLDATNIIENTLLSVITPISLDHTEYLGDNLPKIAVEKAGIMRKNRFTIVSKQEENVFETLSLIAEDLGSTISAYEYDYGLNVVEDKVYYVSKDFEVEIPSDKGLAGEHQYINAAAAIDAVKHSGLVQLDLQKVIEGLKNVKWRGRLEKIEAGQLKNELGENDEIWLDGAHNPGGSAILSAFLENKPQEHKYLICGFTRGRSVKDYLSNFNKDLVVCGVTVTNEPSSYSGEFVAEEARKAGFKAFGFNVIEEAIDFIASEKNNGNLIIISGSLYLVGEFLIKNEKVKI